MRADRRSVTAGQRVTRRGRRPVLGRLRVPFAICLVAGAFWAGYRSHDSVSELVHARLDARGTAGARIGAPAAVAARALAAPAPSSPAAPPRDILERLPVGVDDYGSALEVAEGVDPATSPRWMERVELSGSEEGAPTGPLQVEYTFDAELTDAVLEVLRRGRVKRGHVVVLDPRSGRILAFVSTSPESFPPDRSYPAASLIKIVTAAAALDQAPDRAREPCVYRGNQYRLTRSRVYPPKWGMEASLERALATSNNQCFAQLAVDAVGAQGLMSALASFGWLDRPAPGHEPGIAELGEGDYDLGRLGCGLSGCRITPLHAAQLASILTSGMRVTPWWIDRVLDAEGRELTLPPREQPVRVMSPGLAEELREMLVRTTTRGTARSAFRDRRGRPKLGSIRVAGKTGNLSGSNPKGRYEWFVGLAPADAPTVAVAVVQVQDNLWWSRSSEVAADVLARAFCRGGHCDPANAVRYTGDLGGAVRPILLSEALR